MSAASVGSLRRYRRAWLIQVPRRSIPTSLVTIPSSLLALPALHVGESAVPDTARPAAATPLDPERVCVTRAGLCPIGAVRAGDPCTCPDPVRGNVAGHVETVAGPPAVTNPRDWPGGAEDMLYGP